MDTAALRKALDQRLSQLQHPESLQAAVEYIEQLLAKESSEDWWGDLSDEQQSYIKRGIEQGNRGETVSAEDVHRQVEDLLR